MPNTYPTSRNGYDVIIPLTQDQILAMNQVLVPNQNNSYAPTRNNHTFSIMSHDDTHDFYFTPNYDYDRNGIPEYEQVVVIHDEGGGSGADRYSTFTVDENEKTLTIDYNN